MADCLDGRAGDLSHVAQAAGDKSNDPILSKSLLKITSPRSAPWLSLWRNAKRIRPPRLPVSRRQIDNITAIKPRLSSARNCIQRHARRMVRIFACAIFHGHLRPAHGSSSLKYVGSYESRGRGRRRRPRGYMQGSCDARRVGCGMRRPGRVGLLFGRNLQNSVDLDEHCSWPLEYADRFGRRIKSFHQTIAGLPNQMP